MVCESWLSSGSKLQQLRHRSCICRPITITQSLTVLSQARSHQRIIMKKHIALVILLSCGSTSAAFAQILDTPQTRLRPIGSSSLVDRYQPPTLPVRQTEYRPAGFYDSGVRQAAMLQQAGNLSPPPLPGNYSLPPGVVPPASALPNASAPNFSLPPGNVGTTLPQYNSNQNLPTQNLPSTLPSPPPINIVPNQAAAPQTSLPQTRLPQSPVLRDFQPVPQPQLGNEYSTIDNCACISAPSGYSAASVGCGPVTYAAPSYTQAPQAYIAPPAQIAPPTLLPGQVAPISSSAAPLPSLFTLGQEYNPVQVGQGIIGQPVAYVPGQTFRNFLRYLFP